MPGLPITITDAGRAALINAQNTGTVNLTISQIGVSAVHTAGALTGLTVLPNELKRLDTFAGDVVADDTLHLTIRDQSADTYSLRKFGLYLSNGVLFGVYSQAAPILEKSAASMVLLATDIILTALTTANIQFGDTDFINPPATVETPGVAELATKEETLAGADSTRVVTPFGLKWVLDQLLAGYAALVHNHDAAAIVSGVLNVGRIPALGMEKITGLASALAGKSDTGHTHAAGDIVSGVLNVLRIPDLTMAKITDLAAALALKLDGAAFTWNNLPGKPAIVVSDTDAVLRTLQVRMAVPANGSIYFGDQQVGSRRLDFNGDLFKFIGAGLTINGYTPWTNQNFNPADKAAAIHSHDWAQITGKPGNFMYLDSAQVSTARKIFKGDQAGTMAAQVYSTTPLEVQAKDNTAAAVMTFHIPGVAGEKIGLDLDGDWKISRAGAMRRIWTEYNFDPATKATLGAAANFFSVQSAEGGVGGRVKLGDQSGGTRELVYNGINYYLNGADLYVNSSKAWTAATFDPATKAALTHTHTTADITDLLDKFWPAGELRLYAKTSLPSGVRVLAANGAAVSRTTYARLFAEIGTTFGAGDGATTFNLPDFRGVFFRGLDQGRGLDAGRALGVLQMSQNLAHTHSYLLQTGVDNTQAGSGVQGGAAYGGEVTGSSGGSEARPTNQALLACITY